MPLPTSYKPQASSCVLGIETSCDETAAAVVENGTRVLSTVISSSRQFFENLAGVIPEQAARRHIDCIMPAIDQALAQAAIAIDDLDAIAVTRGPGLLGSLLVGTTTARILSSVTGLPLTGVHHTLGHLSSTWLDVSNTPLFPVITLSASGGHTELWYREDHLRGMLLGRTRDDAAGEAFDKGASLLGLPYPGGPSIAAASETGDPETFSFPLPLHGETGFDFSFSGLKTSLKYLLRDLTKENAYQLPATSYKLADLAASYQHAICRHLADRLARAIDHCPDVREVHLVGGVSANTHLRSIVADLCTRNTLTLRTPAQLSSCTDNAAMIAAAGFFLLEDNPAAAVFTTSASLPLEMAIRTP